MPKDEEPLMMVSENAQDIKISDVSGTRDESHQIVKKQTLSIVNVNDAIVVEVLGLDELKNSIKKMREYGEKIKKETHNTVSNTASDLRLIHFC